MNRTYAYNGRIARNCRAAFHFLIGVYGNPPSDAADWIAPASFAVRVFLITGGVAFWLGLVL